jgi:hypothetical protein
VITGVWEELLLVFWVVWLWCKKEEGFKVTHSGGGKGGVGTCKGSWGWGWEETNSPPNAGGKGSEAGDRTPAPLPSLIISTPVTFNKFIG